MKSKEEWSPAKHDGGVQMDPRTQFCMGVYNNSRECFVWTPKFRDPDNTTDVEYLLRWVDYVRYDVVEVPWKIWRGEIDGRPQLTIGTSKPKPTCRVDNIGKMLARGTWDKMFPLFCQYMRMLQ